MIFKKKKERRYTARPQRPPSTGNLTWHPTRVYLLAIATLLTILTLTTFAGQASAEGIWRKDGTGNVVTTTISTIKIGATATITASITGSGNAISALSASFKGEPCSSSNLPASGDTDYVTDTNASDGFSVSIVVPTIASGRICVSVTHTISSVASTLAIPFFGASQDLFKKPASVTATRGDTQVTLGWAAASGAPNHIRGYQYRSKASDSQTWGSWTDISGSDHTTTSHTVTGLTNDTPYDFQVRSRVNNGTISSTSGGFIPGDTSDTVSATPVAIPTAPTAIVPHNVGVDGFTYDLENVTVTLPSGASPTSTSTLTVFSYTPT
ncbi:MAG: fibronectin type III domain-containing protein, partial [Candidatus Kaiserbacteria bacterium]|nr:fibronectin type III domain-containing protein [Candidatus Kaiserbacteria bacterium]